MIDKDLLTLLHFEERMYREIVGDRREGFTEEHQKKSRELIRDILFGGW